MEVFELDLEGSGIGGTGIKDIILEVGYKYDLILKSTKFTI